MTNTVTFHVGDVRDVQAAMPDGSIDLLVTSPPFLALRSYLPDDHPDKHREIGAEPTPAAFLDTMMGLTTDWRRLLASWGSLCVEFGDTYSGSGGAGGDYYNEDGWRAGQPKPAGSAKFRDGYVRNDRPNRPPQENPKAYGTGDAPRSARVGRGERRDVKHHRGGNDAAVASRAAQKRDVIEGWPLGKSLCLLPTLYAACLAYGRNLLNPAMEVESWRVRNLMAWTRPNPPVGSLGKINPDTATGDQRFRCATSFVTVACVDRHRWFDLEAVRSATNPNTHARTARGVDREARSGKSADEARGGNWATLDEIHLGAGAPPLDWWDAADVDDAELAEHWALTELLAEDWQPFHRMSSMPYPGQHYATFPERLPRRLIEAMCPLEVCATCGRPRLRRTEPAAEYGAARERIGDMSKRKTGTRLGIGQTGNNRSAQLGTMTAAEFVTVGWTDCGHGDYRPGIVLDPFGGSGTTAVAAVRCGRDAVLVDLDVRNVDLCRRRLSEQVLVLDERAEGSSVVWVVDAKLPGTRGEAPGQQSLFA